MLIMTQNGQNIIDTNKMIALCVDEVIDDDFEETDVVSVEAALENGNLVLGEYADMSRGKEVLAVIFDEMSHNVRSYVMPEE